MEDIIDAPVVVRTCKETIGQGKFRNGMYRMNKEVHEDLVKKQGFYLFMTYLNSGGTYLKLVAANDITYARNICWTRI